MKTFASTCLAAALALTVAGCGPAPTAPAPDTHDADVKALNDIEEQWNQEYAAKDLGKIIAHYADDAVLITPGAPAVKGKDGIQKAMQQFTSDPAMSLKFKPSKIDVSKSGDLGYTEGSYTMTVTDPATHKMITDLGSYVTTYRKQADGSWKAVADIACSSTPPPAPPKHK